MSTLFLFPSRYAKRGSTTTAYRTVNTGNVLAYAGNTPKEDIQLSTQEVVSYTGGVLSYSRGSTSVVFSAAGSTSTFAAPAPSVNKKIVASVPQYRNDNGQRKKRQAFTSLSSREPNTFSSGTDLNEFKGSGSYSLTKVSCRAAIGKAKRSAFDSLIEDFRKESDKNDVRDSLRAKINFSKCTLKYTIHACYHLPSAHHHVKFQVLAW